MATKKSKSAVNESFKQGFGAEAGKRFAAFLIGLLVLIGFLIWGYISDSPAGSSIQEFNKTNSQPSNSQ